MLSNISYYKTGLFPDIKVDIMRYIYFVNNSLLKALKVGYYPSLYIPFSQPFKVLSIKEKLYALKLL